jgi:hypothetical protein
VTIHEHRAPRRLGALRKPSAEELAAERKLGLVRREDWRAEKAGQIDTANGSAVGASKPASSVGGGGFAEGIARAEFGRFYWNARLERALDAAQRRGPSTPQKKRK